MENIEARTRLARYRYSQEMLDLRQILVAPTIDLLRIQHFPPENYHEQCQFIFREKEAPHQVLFELSEKNIFWLALQGLHYQ